MVGTLLLGAALTGRAAAPAPHPAIAGPATTELGRRARELLTDRCLACHGPDAAARRGDLRLDTREGVLAGRRGGAAVVPGDPASSPLWRRISASEPEARMPPSDSGLALTAAERETLRHWIEAGAPFPRHWSFEPSVDAAPPADPADGWSRDPLDRLVLATLDAEGLEPAPEAPRALWLRRVTFALTGLPPTLEELDDFLADPAEGAHERVVDRLLASPRYGERMASDWLDVARYADSYGYQNDVARDVWPWRDWVVEAFDANLPWDRFVTWQLAGDLLPDATREQRLATTFQRLHRQTNEGGSVDEEFRVAYVSDRVNTFGTAFLGLTLECARCHDHKFDPVTQREYYALSAFFDDIDESGTYSHFTSAVPTPTLDLPSADQERELAALEHAVERAERALASARAEAHAALAGPAPTPAGDLAPTDSPTPAGEPSPTDSPTPAGDLAPTDSPTPAGDLAPTDSPTPAGDLAPTDSPTPAGDLAPIDSPARVDGHAAATPSTAGVDPPATDDLPLLEGCVAHLTFDVIGEDGSLPNAAAPDAPGRVLAGPTLVPGARGLALALGGEDGAGLPGVAAFRRSDPFSIALWVRVGQAADRAILLHRSRAWTDAGSQGYQLLLEDGRPSASLIHFWPGNACRVRAVEPLPMGTWVHLAMTHDGSGRAAGLGLWVDGQRAPVEVVRDGLTRGIARAGGLELTVGQRFRDRGFAGGAVDELLVFERELDGAEVRHLATGGATTAVVQRDADEHLSARVTRSPDVVVARAALASARAARDALRDAVPAIMTMAELPEPRRAHVLRRGAYDDRGEAVEPDTPAMLPAFPAGAPRDRLGLAQWLTAPDHPLFARVTVNRLWQQVFGRGLVATAEDLGRQGSTPRHQALLDHLSIAFQRSGWDVKALLRRLVLSSTYRQASGVDRERLQQDPDNAQLARGPALRLTAEMIRDGALAAGGLLVERRGGPPVKPYQPAGLWREKSGATYEPDEGEGLWRRSLYTFWKRTSPPPSMRLFDAAKRDVCVARRGVTSTPLQALVLWNDPQLVEAARGLAARELSIEGDDEQRLARMFRRLTARLPTDEQHAALASLLAASRALYAGSPEQAAALLAVGRTPPPESPPPAELAAWSVVASSLLAYDGTLVTR